MFAMKENIMKHPVQHTSWTVMVLNNLPSSLFYVIFYSRWLIGYYGIFTCW